ncbi:hypothetical protein [Legionella fallonii]|uniref:Uncharacterized protein n=1 Tax=Legionella fallonii LLAP-10 TaxID=1212491 RepID=A0A098G0Y0_9GAMM|nr:hypothetical protein [Legionella fallonii]CEG55634.1 protein of unknown function [Legionella fallonii LLAP-10]
MKQNIQELLKELVSYTMIRTSHISSEAKTVLFTMRKEFERLLASDDADKQKKMIALFMGGTIYALKQDDWKYRFAYDVKLYPAAISKDVLQNLNEKNSIVENIYAIGNQALLFLPQQSFNADLFKLEVRLINSQKPIAFFPDLQRNADRINLLVAFCTKYAHDLEHAEIDSNELNPVDLKQDKPKVVTANNIEPLHKDHHQETSTSSSDEATVNEPKITRTNSPSSSFSNISMQVLGGFLAAIGAAAVAVAFVVLNAATLGLAGLITAGLGVASILGGVGLFGTGAYRGCQSTPDASLNNSPGFAAI